MPAIQIRLAQPVVAADQSVQPLDWAVDAAHKRLVTALGELRLRCTPESIDDDLASIADWLGALDHRLAPGKLEAWRHAVLTQLEAPGTLDTRQLCFSFTPQAAALGLASPLSFKLALRPIEHDQSARITLLGRLLLPCAPSLMERNLALVEKICRALAPAPGAGATAGWRQTLAEVCEREFALAAETRLCVNYTSDADSGRIHLALQPRSETMASQYADWLREKEGPLFGAHADARVVALASKHPRTRSAPVLDIGAGTGRNSLAIAARGFEVHALDVMPGFAARIAEQAAAQNLPVESILGDLLDPDLRLPAERYAWILASQVLPHFRSLPDLARFFRRACELLEPGGTLLCNLFVTADETSMTPALRELSQIRWSFAVTQRELQGVYGSLPLELAHNESYYDYEKRRLPAAVWPPTPWFENWSTGRNVLPTRATPPLALRWLQFRRT